MAASRMTIRKDFMGQKVTIYSFPATPKMSGNRRHFRLKIHSQTIGNSVDVVEVTDDLRSITDGLGRKARSLQFCHIGVGDAMRVACQFFRPRAQCLVNLGQARIAPVFLERLGLPGVLDFITEVRPMGLGSVMATVGGGNHCGQHLPLCARER